jgi:hypothetical protein
MALILPRAGCRISIEPRPCLKQRHVSLRPIRACIPKNPRGAFALDQHLIPNNSNQNKPCPQMVAGIADLTEGE